MFDIRSFYEKDNAPILKDYNNSIDEINNIVKESGQKQDNYSRFFNHTGSRIVKLCERAKAYDSHYFSNRSFEDLLEENHDLYRELLPDNYQSCYANPSYCVSVFGDQFGQLMSYLYMIYRQYITYSIRHKLFLMAEYNQLFIRAFQFLQNNKPDYEEMRRFMTVHEHQDKSRDFVYRNHEIYNKDFRFYTDVIEDADLADLRYLFRTNDYITDYEIKSARFINQYPEAKIKTLATTFVKAYITGFESTNKTMLTGRDTVSFYYSIGQEKVYREVIRQLRSQNLHCSIMGAASTSANKQYFYDHQFDQGLYLDEAYVDVYLSSHKKAFEQSRDICANYSGVLAFQSFGEPPFSPENKKESLTLNAEQKILVQKMNQEYMQTRDQYLPREETSFSIISFPSPEIGEQFEKIYDEIFTINMLEVEKYERIQQTMIDVLDQADYVHIKGNRENLTDIKIQMNQLTDPDKETLFFNCGADLNIPLGEVFTSPKLTGTHGVLHVKTTYQNSLRYDDLKLTFKDGFIADYACANFDAEKENKKYIEDNLLFPHKTLPIGEFAIGTNTPAYVISEKYDILALLPVLIVEKMGPHIAIGDTCFSRQEDHKEYNRLNQKEIVARDNEKSIKRKTNPTEAYTNKHSDITLPYCDLEFISAVKKDGERVDIIRDSRFVLEGTEELNRPLDEL